MRATDVDNGAASTGRSFFMRRAVWMLGSRSPLYYIITSL